MINRITLNLKENASLESSQTNEGWSISTFEPVARGNYRSAIVTESGREIESLTRDIEMNHFAVGK